MARLTRDQQREQTRQRLREALVMLVAERGFNGASIDGIAAAAGYSRGAFYANYDSKEELLIDAAMFRQHDETDAWIKAIEECDSVSGLLPALDTRFAEFIADERWNLFTIELRLHAQRDPVFGASYEQAFHRVTERVGEMLQKMFQKAGATPRLPLTELVPMVSALTVGLVLGNARDKEPQRMDHRLLTLFLADQLGLEYRT
jgi:AcrR family transcriptional regulator